MRRETAGWLAVILLLLGGLLVPAVAFTETARADGTTFYATSSDGCLFAWGWDYYAIHDASTGSVDQGYVPNLVGQSCYFGGSAVYRTALFFNTSYIPDNATITGASLSLYGTCMPPTTFDYSIAVVRGADLNEPLVPADYGDLLDETISMGQRGADNWIVGGWNPIELNSSGLAQISKTGITKLGLRSTKDIDRIWPYFGYQGEFVGFSSAEQGNPAQLWVTWEAAPAVPTVTTDWYGTQNSVSYTTATLKGYLNDDGGEPCQWRFQWGETDSYGNETGWMGSITSCTWFEWPLSGLEAGRTYHFRAQCRNSAGVGSGADETFQTLFVESADDSVSELGADWIGHYDDMPTIPSWQPTYGFVDKLVSAGWQKNFLWEDDTAYESDFKRDDSGGEDHIWVDAVDIAWFAGHGNGGELYFNYGQSEEDRVLKSFYLDRLPGDHPLAYQDEARWGDQDLEWIFLFSCNTLQRYDGTKGGSDFGWALNGAHLVCGAVDKMWVQYDDGFHVARYLVDYDWKVVDSWFWGCNVHQPAGRMLRVIGENEACGDDHIWGHGWVSQDPPLWDANIAEWHFVTTG